MAKITETQRDIMYKMASNYNEMLEKLRSIELNNSNYMYKKNILNEFEEFIKEME